MKGIFFIYFIGVSIFLILPKPWLDKKIERWFEAISTTSPKTLKYFYLFSFFAGIFSSLGLTSMIVFALYWFGCEASGIAGNLPLDLCFHNVGDA